MILTAHQPGYLPWLGLFHKIALADTFVSFNQAQYVPKSWHNRNKIKTSDGAIWITVPVLRSGYRDKAMSDIVINNDLPWREKHWKSIYLSYKKAPYFHRYAPFLEDVYKKGWTNLVALNEYMLKHFLEFLGIKVNFMDASQFVFKGENNDLILDMCGQLNADTYIFGSLGKDYADKDMFSKRGINLMFQEYRHPVYRQLHGEYISHLSVIDLLFNCGEESLDILMSSNLKKDDIYETGVV